jgi:NDP-sugar pyrophosphorylase family protein
MRAMILAAGLGTRLRPLTNDRPKALVEINGRTLLEITLARLRSFGVRDVIVNVHHFADMVVDYLNAQDSFGMRIEISREEVLLDTGGGLKKAGHFFLEDNAGEHFLVHNVDVLSNIDFGRLVQLQLDCGALATLAVQERASSRQLLFDDNNRLCGRRTEGDPSEVVRSAPRHHRLAFCGIHVISRRIFPLLTEEGAFPVVPAYLRLAAQGETILGFRADEYSWRDLGTVDSIRRASADQTRTSP